MPEKNIKIIGGEFAIEMPDELPPIEAIRFVDERGKFSKEKPPTEEDISYFWRKKQRLLWGLILFSALGILLIFLGSTEKYAAGVWGGISGIIGFMLSFIIGLLPEGLFSWIPF